MKRRVSDIPPYPYPKLKLQDLASLAVSFSRSPQSQIIRKLNENITLEWESFRHPFISLSQTEVAGVVITRNIILQIAFEEVLLQPHRTVTKHEENTSKTVHLNGRVSGIHPYPYPKLKLQELSSLAISLCRSLSRRSRCSPPAQAQNTRKITRKTSHLNG